MTSSSTTGGSTCSAICVRGAMRCCAVLAAQLIGHVCDTLLTLFFSVIQLCLLEERPREPFVRSGRVTPVHRRLGRVACSPQLCVLPGLLPGVPIPRLAPRRPAESWRIRRAGFSMLPEAVRCPVSALRHRTLSQPSRTDGSQQEMLLNNPPLTRSGKEGQDQAKTKKTTERKKSKEQSINKDMIRIDHFIKKQVQETRDDRHSKSYCKSV